MHHKKNVEEKEYNLAPKIVFVGISRLRYPILLTLGLCLVTWSHVVCPGLEFRLI
jgi:thiosulfate reductase cytochrome b subunit